MQAGLGHLDDLTVDLIATTLGIPRVDVKSLTTFYSFLRHERTGRHTIRLCNDVIDRQQGIEAVARTFEQELGLVQGAHPHPRHSESSRMDDDSDDDDSDDDNEGDE